jgi:hypothetical protein
MWEQSDVYLPEEAFKRSVRDLSCGLVEVIAPSQDDDSLSVQVHGNGPKAQLPTVQLIHETVRTFFVGDGYAKPAESHPYIGQSRSGKAHQKVMQACLNYIATRDVIDAHADRVFAYTNVWESEKYQWDFNFCTPFLPFAVRWLYDHIVSTETKASEAIQVQLHRLLGGPVNKTWEALRRIWSHGLLEAYELQRSLRSPFRDVAVFFDFAAIHGLSYSVSAGLKDSGGAGPRTSGGETALMKLLSWDCNSAARFLVAQGIDVRARDESGRSALFYTRSVEMVEMLLEAGAEVNEIWYITFGSSWIYWSALAKNTWPRSERLNVPHRGRHYRRMLASAWGRCECNVLDRENGAPVCFVRSCQETSTCRATTSTKYHCS